MEEVEPQGSIAASGDASLNRETREEAFWPVLPSLTQASPRSLMSEPLGNKKMVKHECIPCYTEKEEFRWCMAFMEAFIFSTDN